MPSITDSSPAAAAAPWAELLLYCKSGVSLTTAGAAGVAGSPGDNVTPPAGAAVADAGSKPRGYAASTALSASANVGVDAPLVDVNAAPSSAVQPDSGRLASAASAAGQASHAATDSCACSSTLLCSASTAATAAHAAGLADTQSLEAAHGWLCGTAVVAAEVQLGCSTAHSSAIGSRGGWPGSTSAVPDLLSLLCASAPPSPPLLLLYRLKLVHVLLARAE